MIWPRMKTPTFSLTVPADTFFDDDSSMGIV